MRKALLNSDGIVQVTRRRFACVLIRFRVVVKSTERTEYEFSI
jgi:hypothetical protein